MIYTIHLTSKDGSEATLTGAEACIEAVEAALTKAGWLFHLPIGCWDEGFYTSDPTE